MAFAEVGSAALDSELAARARRKTPPQPRPSVAITKRKSVMRGRPSFVKPSYVDAGI